LEIVHLSVGLYPKFFESCSQISEDSAKKAYKLYVKNLLWFMVQLFGRVLTKAPDFRRWSSFGCAAAMRLISLSFAGASVPTPCRAAKPRVNVPEKREGK
jgi:hypothetical protein